jgi:hypothetical protein
VCGQVWELVHKGSGYSAIIIAMATMFKGFDVIEPVASSVVVILYAIWVGIIIVSFAVLSITTALANRKEAGKALPVTSAGSASSAPHVTRVRDASTGDKPVTHQPLEVVPTH